MNALDRVLLELFPRWTLDRIRARMTAQLTARYYEAARPGRRTQGWRRSGGDANLVNAPAISILREHSRDLVRNNPWAKRGRNVKANNTVSWGIVPAAVDVGARATAKARDLWKAWGETTQCDFYGRRNFYGLQKAVMKAKTTDGEALIRRRRRPPGEGLAIPLQLQLLEADFIDTLRDGETGAAGGPIVQGVEFDGLGRRAAYWLYDEHPGSFRSFGGGGSLLGRSKRVPVEDIIHVYEEDRPGQVRGISDFSTVIVRLKGHDELEDATLMKQKIAACFVAAVTDVDGAGAPVAEPDQGQDPAKPRVETFEPGMIHYLPIGRDIKFGTPPAVSEHEAYSNTVLRGIAAGLGITLEDLTGNYQRMPFSAARMSRVSHWENVHEWRWDMLVPQMCDPAWRWAMEAALVAGAIGEIPRAKWTPPPMPMIEPDKEGLAFMRLVRAGAMTHAEMVRQLGYDPAQHWAEYAEGLAMLDALGIVLDSDARKTSQTGQLHPPEEPEGGGDTDPDADPDG